MFCWRPTTLLPSSSMSGKEANKAKPATFIYGRKLAKLYEDCALGSEALPGPRV